MTINERIRYFRKNILHINQHEFAADLRMAQSAISSLEQNGVPVNDRTVKFICMTYGINEDWLRSGTEPIYIQSPVFSFDEFMKKRRATEFELNMLKAYFNIDPKIRKFLLHYFKERTDDNCSEFTREMSMEETDVAYIKSRLKKGSPAPNKASTQ